MTSNYKSRKLWGAIVLYLTATAFVVFNKATFAEWYPFVVFIYGIYSGSNVLTKKLIQTNTNETSEKENGTTG